ncbi:unnamed protein product [Caenorhabditis nigoni]
MPIALLNFPSDLLGEVFKQCDPYDLYFLSKCSKRARSCVKLGGTRKWKISGSDSIEIRCPDGSNYEFLEEKNRDDNVNIGWKKAEPLYIEFPDGGVSELLTYLLDTFGIRCVEWLGTGRRNSIPFFNGISPILINRNMEIEEFDLNDCGNVSSIVNIMPLVKQLNITEGFESFVDFPSDFCYQFTQYPKRIALRYSIWFTIDQLMNSTCVRIELYESMLSNQDFDIFLRNWKKIGTFPNLQWLEVESNHINRRSSILDMVPPIKNTDNPMEVVKTFVGGYGNCPVSVQHGVKIIKEDGTEGWLKVDTDRAERKLEFIVYDPTNTVMTEALTNKKVTF